uniref:Uncharacterized protein n=1 Tax=Ditylum brightwellii TaxID=49249 RepID=A0A7S1Z2A1_9STRA
MGTKKLLLVPLSATIIMFYYETKVLDQVFIKINTYEKLSSSSLFYPSDTPDAFFKELKAEVNTNPSPDFKLSNKVTLVKSNPPFFACNAPKTGCTAWKYF